jgi:hypothetical protein
MRMWTHVLDRFTSSAGLEVEEDDMRDAHFGSGQPSDWNFGLGWRRSKKRFRGVKGYR